MQNSSETLLKAKKSKTGLDGSVAHAKSLARIPVNRLHRTKLDKALRKIASADPSHYTIKEDTMAFLHPSFVLPVIKNPWIEAPKICSAQNWKSIHHLNIIFWKDSRYHSNWPRSIIKFIKSFENLKQLSLTFGGCSLLFAKHLEMIIFELSKCLTKLEDLTIDVSDCGFFKETSLYSALSLSSRNLANLKRFKLVSLNLQHVKGVNDDLFAAIAVHIGSKLSRLQELELYLGRCRVSSEPWQITDEGLKILGSRALKKLIHLKTLTLYFEWHTQISDKGLKSIVTTILNNNTGLESLTISFGGNDKITAESIKSVGTELCKKGKNLKQLTIAFEHCTGIFPNDLKALRKKIEKGLPQLEEFNLSTKAINYRMSHEDPVPV